MRPGASEKSMKVNTGPPLVYLEKVGKIYTFVQAKNSEKQRLGTLVISNFLFLFLLLSTFSSRTTLSFSLYFSVCVCVCVK